MLTRLPERIELTYRVSGNPIEVANIYAVHVLVDAYATISTPPRQLPVFRFRNVPGGGAALGQVAQTSRKQLFVRPPSFYCNLVVVEINCLQSLVIVEGPSLDRCDKIRAHIEMRQERVYREKI